MKENLVQICRLKESSPKFVIVEDRDVLYKDRDYLCRTDSGVFQVCVHGTWGVVDRDLVKVSVTKVFVSETQPQHKGDTVCLRQ